MERVKGEVYQTDIAVLKQKDGVPSSVLIDGHTYALIHPSYINGRKSKVKKKASKQPCGI